MDGNGNIKFDKAKAREKIDGMVALGMAFGAYLAAKKDEESIYEKRGIIMF
jgi:phage terminase large subunit-like protein